MPPGMFSLLTMDSLQRACFRFWPRAIPSPGNPMHSAWSLPPAAEVHLNSTATCPQPRPRRRGRVARMAKTSAQSGSDGCAAWGPPHGGHPYGATVPRGPTGLTGNVHATILSGTSPSDWLQASYSAAWRRPRPLPATHRAPPHVLSDPVVERRTCPPQHHNGQHRHREQARQQQQPLSPHIRPSSATLFEALTGGFGERREDLHGHADSVADPRAASFQAVDGIQHVHAKPNIAVRFTAACGAREISNVVLPRRRPVSYASDQLQSRPASSPDCSRQHPWATGTHAGGVGGGANRARDLRPPGWRQGPRSTGLLQVWLDIWRVSAWLTLAAPVDRSTILEHIHTP